MADQIMAESKTPKPGLLRRILWWLWVVLLTALLALGFVFAAPWKVITLIAIFLAAATILPRIYRKWFWLGVGIVVLAIVAWIFLPDDNKDWRPYTFDKELAQLQAKYAVPDSENAAIIYNQILETWKQKETNEPNLPDDWRSLTLNGPWLSKDQPEIAAYIQYHRDTIEAVLPAAKIVKCSFPIVSNFCDLTDITNRTSAIRKWGRLLIASANNDIAEGKTNDALEKYFAVIRLGQHFSRQSGIIDTLVGIGIENSTLGGINNFIVLCDANESYLNETEQSVSSINHDFGSDLLGFIDSEKLMFKNMMGCLFYEVNPKDTIRLNHDYSAIIRNLIPADALFDSNEFTSGYWWKKLMKSQTILLWFYAPANPAKLSHIIDASFEKHYEMTKPDFDWSKEPRNNTYEFHFKLNVRNFAELMASINRSVYPGLHDNYLRIAAQQKGTLLIIAMRRYKNANGHWPEKLEDIKNSVPPEVFVDPVNNGSFVYKQTDDGFTLYGKGKNGIDDGGIDIYSEDKGGPDDLLIWPFKSKVSRQQEQKATE
jgi:hypothetical protein